MSALLGVLAWCLLPVVSWPLALAASAHALLADLLWAPVESPIRRHAQARPALEAYCQRMKARYYA